MTKEHPMSQENQQEIEAVIQALTSGLKGTYKLHEGLGESGTTNFQENQFGETTLTMDLQSEEEIINGLKKTNLPMSVFAEEHGSFFVNGANPQYVVALDGLDGSSEYKERRGKSMYGTLACVLKGNNPTYDDYIVAGVMIHSPKPNLLLAIKGQGVFSIVLSSGEKKQIGIDTTRHFSRQTIIDLDINWQLYRQLFDENSSLFPNMQCPFFSEAARLALFAKGKIDLGLEWTRKQNLEQPTMYAFVKELGGVMTSADGTPISNKPYKTYGQGIHVPLIVAPNQEMAIEVSKRFNLRKF
ncbi:hypothetical protein KKG52_01305 [Patescibacteria group bacterium]|nr:hypothetical protein [Patescibacteria group bacterium]